MSYRGQKIIAEIPGTEMKYLYHSVIGDGSCFLNCYLTIFSDIYRNTDDVSKKLNIAYKFRLDFVNFLLSESKKTKEEICLRLNILNPDVMSKLVSFKDNSMSSYEILFLAKEAYVNGGEENVYSVIFSFTPHINGRILAYEDVKNLFETDPRINLSLSEQISSEMKEKFDPSIYGYGKIPINIGYYELVNSISIPYTEFLKMINIFTSKTEFLTHVESDLVAKFLDLNLTIFPLGTGYRGPRKLIDSSDGAPEIMFININNIHWDLISFFNGESETFVMYKIPDRTKQALFDKLNSDMPHRGL